MSLCDKSRQVVLGKMYAFVTDIALVKLSYSVTIIVKDRVCGRV